MAKFNAGQVFKSPGGFRWVAGGRGKPPAWVIAQLAATPVPATVIAREIPPLFIPATDGMQVWKHTGSKFLVVAKDARQAMAKLNLVFKQGVTLPEWRSSWQMVEDTTTFGAVDMTMAGVWNQVNSIWMEKKRA